MLENMLQPDRPQITIWRTRIACWISMAANTQSEYVILIAFPRQKLFRESPSVLRYTQCLPWCVLSEEGAQVTSRHFLINKNKTMEKQTCVSPEQLTITHLI